MKINDLMRANRTPEINEAIDKARLSRRQTEAVTYMYGLGLSVDRAAAEMGVSPAAANRYRNEAVRKIGRTLKAGDA